MRRTILVSSLLLALSAPVMASQVYKWVDAQGVTHFGAQPPQGQQATQINTSTPPPRAVETPPTPAAPTFDSIADPEQEAINEQVRKDVAAQEAERRKYCEAQRSNLAQLENNPRLRLEVEGEVTRLSEDERQARITETRKAITDNCK
ncbi:MAG: DUF4124 domain-containing protein [Gammaproteobacteria bacterium]|nr:DUF4124 domain-containing protein [Gammaproteobacteria bacterium]MBU1489451.1 DUF4124 domain-containing protein [Gammaproteobacteria bacterium]MBU2066687.1 DUF4124 domain-containing protein [Gammaproteobacteria bacterium]MBU2137600.1 DUF4124 domain-containing protein [Gammaproteobacteria bacterium]MBU2217261.1 DUF4124 domain-containing protein [Gammaproteobacteria bacterium]